MNFAQHGVYLFPAEYHDSKSELFKYGQWRDRGETELSEGEKTKLRQLTVISLCIKAGLYIDYSSISYSLEIPEDEVESFLMQCIDAGAIDARLDALNSRAVIFDCAERNVSKSMLSDTIAFLREMESAVSFESPSNDEPYSIARSMGRKRHYDESDD